MEEQKKKKEATTKLPEWAEGALFYQLFVDRFNRSKSYHVNDMEEYRHYRKWGEEVNWQADENGEFTNNDFFRGNIRGITEKLSYLKFLGVDVLYLSPINFSLTRYDRYAVTDHLEMDPDVGTFKDLKELHDTANAMGMHIILDIAFNHCSTDNPIFKDAISNPNSIHKDWFKRDGNGNIVFWYNFKDMPEFNLESAGYQDYVFGENGVISEFSPYVDGFRLDLAECLTPTFIEGIKKQANKYFPHLIVGEYWQNPDPSLIGSAIDSPTSYPLTNAILKSIAYGEFNYLRDLTKDMISKYPKDYLNSFLVSLDTHDIVRVLTIFGRLDLMRNGYQDIWKIDEPPTRWHRDGKFYTQEFRQFEYDNEKLTDEQYKNAVNMLKLAMCIQYFYIGSPCLYYGTEIGMQGFKDPFNRRCMSWTGNFDKDLLDFVMKLGKFRAMFNFKGASMPNIVALDSEMLCFTRESVAKNNKIQKIFVAVNRGNNERVIKNILDDIDNSSFSSSTSFDMKYDERQDKIFPGGCLIKIMNK